MFAGHLGAGLAFRRRDAPVNLGWLFIAAMLLDHVLWALVLASIEGVRVPPNYQTATDLRFDFPYSHSLVASLIWSIAGAVLFWIMATGSGQHKRFGALLTGGAVFSHFVLDWLVHEPEMPVLGEKSAKLGLGLWRHLPLAWSLEAVILVVGLWLYLHSANPSMKKKIALIAVMALVMVMTVIGQARHGPPPSPGAMAISSLVFILLVAGFGFWIDRPNSTAPHRET